MKSKSTKTKKTTSRSSASSRKATSKSGAVSGALAGISWKAIAAVGLLLVVSVALLLGGNNQTQNTTTAYSAVETSGSASIALETEKQSLAVGETIEVKVYSDSGSEAVNVVQADLGYPASVLEFVSVSEGGALANSAQSEGGNGVVKVARYTDPGTTVTGRQLVATVVFKAIASSETAQISVTDGSQIVRAEDSTDILQNDATSINISIIQ